MQISLNDSQENTHKWRLALENANIGVWENHVDHLSMECTSTFMTMLGYQPEEFEGIENAWESLVHPHDRDQASKAFFDYIEGKTPYFQSVCRMRHKDGSWRWLKGVGRVSEYTTDGNIRKILGTQADISEEVKVQQKLRRLNRLYGASYHIVEHVAKSNHRQSIHRHLCDQLIERGGFSCTWLALHEPDSPLMPAITSGAHQSFTKSIHYTPKQLDQQQDLISLCYQRSQLTHSNDLNQSDNHPEHARALDQGLQSQAVIPLLRQNGELYGMYSVYSRERDSFDEDTRWLLISLGRNIMLSIERMEHEERRLKAEKSMLDNERQICQLIDRMGDAFFCVDVINRSLLYTNAKYHELWDIDLGAMNVERLTSQIHPEDLNAFTTMLEARLRGEEQTDLKYRILRDDEVHAWVHDRAIPVMSDEGELLRIIGMVRDITHERINERNTIRNQRLESIGNLAGGIAHDINNVLSPILLSVDLMRNAPQGDSADYLDLIESSAQRAADLVRQVLSFSRGVEGSRDNIDLREVYAEVDKIVEDTFMKAIHVHQHIDDKLWNIRGDRTQLHQVILNLFVNARDAMPEGGNIWVNISNVALHQSTLTAHGSCPPGEYVKLTIEDSGCGMSQETLDMIFDPFFTTKAQGEGTGLGLPTSFNIVKSHNGYLQVTSKINQGTTFSLYLPKMQIIEATSKLDQFKLRPDISHWKHVLLVDDEKVLLQTLNRTLREQGCQVTTATNGIEAQQQLIQSRHCDLIITDLMMPKQGGHKFIEWLANYHPQIPVIITSGLELNTHNRLYNHPNILGKLHKPYTADTLLATLSQTSPPQSQPNNPVMQ